MNFWLSLHPQCGWQIALADSKIHLGDVHELFLSDESGEGEFDSELFGLDKENEGGDEQQYFRHRQCYIQLVERIHKKRIMENRRKLVENQIWWFWSFEFE